MFTRSRSHCPPAIAVPALVAMLVALSLAAEPAPRQPDRDAARWFAMSPQQFSETDAAQRLLDNDDPDQTLLAAAILHETNRHRREHGLRPLQHLPALAQAALLHAQAMAQGEFMAHVNPDDEQLREPIDRVRHVGLEPRYVAENVATHFGIQYESGRRVFPLSQWGREGFSYQRDGEPIPRHTYHTFARSLVQQWMDSPEHRDNILSEHPRFHAAAAIPVTDDDGMDTWYCAQKFFTPMPPGARRR